MGKKVSLEEMRRSLRFVWEMTEKDFRELLDPTPKDYGCPDGPFGQLYCGDVCVDFMRFDDEMNNHRTYCTPGHYIFVAGIETGYGYTEDDVPYDLISDIMRFPYKKQTDFNSFKQNFEKALIRYARGKNGRLVDCVSEDVPGIEKETLFDRMQVEKSKWLDKETA